MFDNLGQKLGDYIERREVLEKLQLIWAAWNNDGSLTEGNEGPYRLPRFLR